MFFLCLPRLVKLYASRRSWYACLCEKKSFLNFVCNFFVSICQTFVSICINKTCPNCYEIVRPNTLQFKLPSQGNHILICNSNTDLVHFGPTLTCILAILMKRANLFVCCFLFLQNLKPTASRMANSNKPPMENATVKIISSEKLAVCMVGSEEIDNRSVKLHF